MDHLKLRLQFFENLKLSRNYQQREFFIFSKTVAKSHLYWDYFIYENYQNRIVLYFVVFEKVFVKSIFKKMFYFSFFVK